MSYFQTQRFDTQPIIVTHSGAAASGSDRVMDSETLMQGRKAMTIVHNGRIYRLQTTKQGKLILTK